MWTRVPFQAKIIFFFFLDKYQISIRKNYMLLFLTDIREITSVRNNILESSLKCAISLYILSAFCWNCIAVEYLYNHWVNDLSLYMWSGCSWLVVILSFFRVLQFPPPIKLNGIILLKLSINILKSYNIFRIFLFCC